ncbi:hypothetical protein TNCV_2860201 [Trichonephila clavipes]|nr:hypothetical protein TNCV_2860201 [Trichonephila clavipes]
MSESEKSRYTTWHSESRVWDWKGLDLHFEIDFIMPQMKFGGGIIIEEYFSWFSAWLSVPLAGNSQDQSQRFGQFHADHIVVKVWIWRNPVS